MNEPRTIHQLEQSIVTVRETLTLIIYRVKINIVDLLSSFQTPFLHTKTGPAPQTSLPRQKIVHQPAFPASRTEPSKSK